MSDKPKSKHDLEKQISDNMNVRPAQYATSIGLGAVTGASDGALVTAAIVGGDMAEKYIQAHNASTISRSGEWGGKVAHGMLHDPKIFTEELEKSGLSKLKGSGFRGFWEYTKNFAKTNKATMAAIGVFTVAMTVAYAWANIKHARKNNDAKIGEAYRTHKIQFDAEPFHDASSTHKYTSRLDQERAQQIEGPSR